MSKVFKSIKVSQEICDQIDKRFNTINDIYKMKRPIIILEISGGVLQRVESTVPIVYYLIDRDNIKSGEEFPEVLDFLEEDSIIPTNEELPVYLKSKSK